MVAQTKLGRPRVHEPFFGMGAPELSAITHSTARSCQDYLAGLRTPNVTWIYWLLKHQRRLHPRDAIFEIASRRSCQSPFRDPSAFGGTPEPIPRPKTAQALDAITPEDLARFTGSSVRSCKDYMAGTRVPTVKWLASLLHARPDLDALGVVREIVSRRKK